MKKILFPYLVVLFSLSYQPVFSQSESDSTLLGLPGDNLDLYAVLDLFQKSKTIEGFEKSLNEQKAGINNLDLDLDKKVDFIKVVTKQKDSSFTFVLQVAVSEKETQDVAVILVDKDKKGKITMQIIGDKELYGKDYIVEPRSSSPSVTANPGYTGSDPVIANIPATTSTTTIVVESAPIVQYVYSPAYVPYYPPYYYGYYPPYFAAFTVMAVGIYRANNYYYHGHGHGYHNTTIIHNENNFNNYNGNRNNSDRVSHNNASGKYGDGNGAPASNRPSTGGPSASTRPSTGAGSANRPSTGGPSASTRPSTGTGSVNRPSTGGPSTSTRPSTSNYSSGGGRTRSSGGFSGGGGGGGFRGGGGGGRRR